MEPTASGMRRRAEFVGLPVASAATLYDLETTAFGADSVPQVLAWARANSRDARLEPILTRVKSVVLAHDWQRATNTPSRLRGTYRVTITAGDSAGTWEFRTGDRPAYRAREFSDRQTLDDLFESPHVAGYQLLAHPADAAGALPAIAPRPVPTEPRRLVWLTVADRLTDPRARDEPVLEAILMFTRSSAPTSIWRALDPFVPVPDSLTVALRDRMQELTGRRYTEGDDQPALPLTLRLQPDGGVRGDTTLSRGGRAVRLTVERVDTVWVRRG